MNETPRAPAAGIPAYGRINTTLYCKLSDNERMTLVIGMIDMLAMLAIHPLDSVKASFKTLTEFARPIGNIDLRNMLDEYIKQDPVRQQYLIASNFTAMLTANAARASLDAPIAPESNNLLGKLGSMFKR